MAETPDTEPLNLSDREAAIAALKAAKGQETPLENPEPFVSAPKADFGVPSKEEFEEPKEAPEPEEPEPAQPVQLSEGQQLKLRLRQEMQRIRAKAQEEYKAAERVRLEAEAERQKLAAEKAAIENQLKEIEQEREFAKTHTKDWLAKQGRPLEQVVRDELEMGKPDARITNLERQLESLLGELKARDEREAEAKRQAEEQRVRQEKEAQFRELQNQQLQAEQNFLKLAAENPDKFPTLSKLVKRMPQMALGQAYAIYPIVKQDLGREPELAELAATIERVFGDDEEEAPKAKKRGVAKPATSATPPAPGNLETLSEDELKELAKREVRKIKATMRDNY